MVPEVHYHDPACIVLPATPKASRNAKGRGGSAQYVAVPTKDAKPSITPLFAQHGSGRLSFGLPAATDPADSYQYFCSGRRVRGRSRPTGIVEERPHAAREALLPCLDAR